MAAVFDWLKKPRLNVAPDPELVPDLDHQDPGLVLDPAAALVAAIREDVLNLEAVVALLLPRIVLDPEAEAHDVLALARLMVKMMTMARMVIVTHDPGLEADPDRDQEVPRMTATKTEKNFFFFLFQYIFLHLNKYCAE